MQNFIYNIPTIVYFGKGQIEAIGEIAKKTGKKALLIYGGGSIKANGIYDDVVRLLGQEGIPFAELSGVEPNPKISLVREGVKICREEGVDMLIPIGGGSVIDTAKAIAGAVSYDGDPWDVVCDASLIKDPLPIIVVLTIAATGSEMDYAAVISNAETKDKVELDHEGLIPKYAIMDPTYTQTVSHYQTIAGIADIMSHVFEQYFLECGDTYLQDQFMEAILRTVMKYGKIAAEHPDDYDARANLMWAQSWAINGMVSCGKSGAWVCHPIEHEISGFYDVTHGLALAIITPNWMRKILDDTIVNEFVSYGVNVLGIDPDQDPFAIARESIDKTEDYFHELGIPARLRDIGVPDESCFEIMAKKALGNINGAYNPLTVEDIVDILKASF